VGRQLVRDAPFADPALMRGTEGDMKRLTGYFFQGLVFLVPIALTIYVFVWAFRIVDGWLGLPVPGLGLVVTLVGITASGFLLSHLVARKLVSGFEAFVTRVPIAKFVYTSIKDLMGAFVGEKRRFDRPVVVDVLPSGFMMLGFITRESLDQFDLAESVAVYFPQSYNFAGMLAVVPRARVRPLSLDGSQFMAFIVSGGITGL
jgi:uncharacterized membrane protein